MNQATLSELPTLTHKAARVFLPVRIVQALAAALFSVTLGLISTSVYLADIGPFYGAGWVSMMFMFGLPLGFLSLLMPYTMPSLSGWWLRSILLLSLLGIGLSIIGGVNVLSTMFSLVP